MSYFEEQREASATHAGPSGLVRAAAVPALAADDIDAGLHLPVQVHLIAPPLVAWGLQRLVQTAGARFILAGSSCGIEEVLAQIERNPPDVVVMDLDDGHGVEDVRRLYDTTRVKILVLTSVSEAEPLAELLNAGARGVLHKREAPSALLKALESVGEGQVVASRPATERMFMAAAQTAAAQSATPLLRRGRDPEGQRVASLTMRERQTIAAVTSDASAPVKVIASRLCISEHTLRNHLTSIYSKLGVTGRLGLHAYASQHALSQGWGIGSAR